MKNFTPKSKNQYRMVLTNFLIKLYVELLKQAPKPEWMSKSIYTTGLAIQILEKLGNNCPSQVEIDMVESIIKCYNRRQSTKLKTAPNQELVNNQIIPKAA